MPNLGEHGRAVVTYRQKGDKVQLSVHGRLLKSPGEFGLPAILLNEDHNLFGVVPYGPAEVKTIGKEVADQLNQNPPLAYERMIERISK